VRVKADLLLCLTSAAAAGGEVDEKLAMAMALVTKVFWFVGGV